MTWIPKYFNAPVDPADRGLHAQLRQKVMPLSRSPFDASHDDPDFDEKTLPSEPAAEEESETEVEAVPEWIELFFDLAWTITFSGLSANTPIKGAMTVVSYLVFFVLAWWLWIAQVLYDTKFYCNDWWHRIFLLLQFILFGALSAFTEGFDVTVGFKSGGGDDDAEDAIEEAYVKRAFLAIAIVFFVSRVLLAIEYARVIRFAKRRRLAHMYMMVGTLVASAILFLGSFLVTRARPDDASAHAIKFAMWGLAIAIEIAAYFYTSMPKGLVYQGSMPNRLSTLTTVVLGEGLNGLIDPVVSAAKSVGFNAKVGGQVIVTALAVFFIFILYFQSFRARSAPTSLRQKLVVMSHFPVQLFIILILEGMKSILNITTLTNSLNYFITKVIGSSKDGVDLTKPTTDMIRAYAQIGVNLPELIAKLVPITGNISPDRLDLNATDADTQALFKTTELTCRGMAAAVQALYKTFKVLEDKEDEQITTYINDNSVNNLAANDTLTMFANPGVFPPTLEKLLNGSVEERLAPATWIAAVSGGFLIGLAVIMACNGLRRNRFEWWCFISRVIGGVAIALLAIVDISATALENWIDLGLFLPAIVLAYALLYIVDYVISVAAARALQSSPSSLRPPSSAHSASFNKSQISLPRAQYHQNYAT
ncbi:hypothetical protein AURDEDRAFT_181068 [Auricularia subglabra TFB-10046 SS5]|nr:hypothetical protein AURDEDRAFT_181068 [Auricularia subglabra TFB-10046 SS5]